MTQLISISIFHSVLLLLYLGISDISHAEGLTEHNSTTGDILNSTEPYASSTDSKIPSKVHGQEETTAITELITSKKPSITKEPRGYSCIQLGILIGPFVMIFIIIFIFIAQNIWRKKKYRLETSEEARSSHQEESGAYGKVKKDEDAIKERYDPLMNQLKEKQNKNNSNR